MTDAAAKCIVDDYPTTTEPEKHIAFQAVTFCCDVPTLLELERRNHTHATDTKTWPHECTWKVSFRIFNVVKTGDVQRNVGFVSTVLNPLARTIGQTWPAHLSLWYSVQVSRSEEDSVPFGTYVLTVKVRETKPE